ncbi:MAG: YARHG domain-containing protein [Clostridiaceae bacterium]|nr:YARHG domain-containing protein [Clostridiaceae bacterium]
MIKIGTDLLVKSSSKSTCVIAVVLLTACLFLLTACGRFAENTAEASPSKTSEAPVETSERHPEASEPIENSSGETELFQNIPRIKETTIPYTYFINTVDNEDILPNITSEPLCWGEALEALSEFQLRLLRNEIYARHGYVFQSKELNDYFSKKSWYKPDPSIREIKLSEIEQANIDLIKSYEDRNSFVLTGGTVISWDLDKDGKKELIQLEAHDCDEYTLHINHASITARGDNLMGYCSVIDIDTSDSQCEILVRSLGPSSDDSFQLYRYLNDRIEQICQVDGLLSDVPGNGYCSIRVRANVLQTWFLLDLYRLNSNGMLEDVEQEIYPVSATIKMSDGEVFLEETPYIFSNQLENEEDGNNLYGHNVITMLKDLPLVKAPSNPQSAGVLKKGERIVFLGSDNKEWVKIQGESGLTGWFQVYDYNMLEVDGNEYTADEFFSSLCHAD